MKYGRKKHQRRIYAYFEDEDIPLQGDWIPYLRRTARKATRKIDSIHGTKEC